MQLLTRLSVTALATVSAVGLIVFACPGLLGRLGVDVGDLPDLLRVVQSARAHGECLDAARAAFDARVRGKEEVARELIDGKVSLVRAAARVRDLCADFPDVPVQIAVHFPGRSDGERMCRHVIYWARELLREEPSRQAEFTQRAEAELRGLLRERGTVVLP